MAEHGKRGPNGGLIDIDDPHEVFPELPRALYVEVREALHLTEWAARERIAGREQNANMMLDRAARRLVNALNEARS